MTPADHRARADAILAEEQSLNFPRFTFADAFAVGTKALELADKPVIVHVSLGELLLFAGAQDGTSPDNQLWLGLKGAVVRRFGKSSLWLHHDLRAKQRTVDDIKPGPEPLADHGGAVPLILGGRAVGLVGVSGLPHEDDHAVAIAALRARLAELAG